MRIQWAMKGLSLDDDAEAERILWPRGLICNWGRTAQGIPLDDISGKLTDDSVDWHVNRFSEKEAGTREPYSKNSPYISLSCGTVQRDAVARANFLYTARRTAMQFGFRFGARSTAYIFVCWVIVAPEAVAEVYSVAEDVRDLTVYRRYSKFQDQGEVAAKLHVPANQIERCEKWTWDREARTIERKWVKSNGPRFVRPERLSIVRTFL